MAVWCLILTITQLMLVLPGAEGRAAEQSRRARRQAVSGHSALWPHGRINYTISNMLMQDTRAVAAIKAAILHWELKTCIRFTFHEEDALDYFSDTYLHFRGSYKCSSSVGMTGRGGAQIIDVSRSCAYTAMMVHELGHAVGMWHEHSRRDRDAHVLVVWKNIKDEAKHNFNIQRDARLLTPYDLFSTMHYEPMMFSKNNKPTLRTLDPRLESLVGWHSSLSHYDVMTASLMYRCSANCTSQDSCENDGFMTSSCICACPRGLHGERCHLVDTDEGCGGLLRVEPGSDQTLLTTPSTRRPHRCTWLLKGPAGTQITLHINSTNLSRDEYDWCRDELEVRYHSVGVPEGYAICKNNGKKLDRGLNDTFLSVDNNIIVHYTTDGQNVDAGFSATVTVRPQQDCASSPCLHGAECEDVAAINTYVCHCPPRYVGKNCGVPIQDGAWSSWGPWSACVAQCGFSSRRRTCTNPRPRNGGLSCSGVSLQTRRCTGPQCQGLFSCDFGMQQLPDDCGLVADTSVPLQWTTIRGKTPSPRTGPESGHTTGDRSDLYMYLEASRGRKYQQAVSWLKVKAPPGDYCLGFYYSMYGKQTGSLSVLLDDQRPDGVRTVWQRSGNQGRGWRAGHVSLHLYPDVRLGFSASRGGTYQGDVALDDISVSPGRCSFKTHSQGCLHKGVEERLGEHFEDREGCTGRTCFCNQDGEVDCPDGPTRDVCQSAPLSEHANLVSGHDT